MCLSIIDSQFNSIMARGPILYDLNPFKCIANCFMAQNTRSSLMNVSYAFGNDMYSAVGGGMFYKRQLNRVG